MFLCLNFPRCEIYVLILSKYIDYCYRWNLREKNSQNIAPKDPLTCTAIYTLARKFRVNSPSRNACVPNENKRSVRVLWVSAQFT